VTVRPRREVLPPKTKPLSPLLGSQTPVSAVEPSDSAFADAPILANLRTQLSEVRSAKRNAIEVDSTDEALRLREQEKELLREIARHGGELR
jgi:uncharacterized membrane protein